ncbi:unnamed protein product [Gongylonema pulchrum]|uniref:Uncharacterized protein n=1 Tax=Gongylonema pulchrum TaxID=637853 RepID=A0A183EGU8_9BILA|nr:unnamed protein product [Gongylonema pulchrum]
MALRSARLADEIEQEQNELGKEDLKIALEGVWHSLRKSIARAKYESYRQALNGQNRSDVKLGLPDESIGGLRREDAAVSYCIPDSYICATVHNTLQPKECVSLSKESSEMVEPATSPVDACSQ